MAFECAECAPGESPGNKLSSVCHHCGKPLCKAHGRVVSTDRAFSDAPGKLDRSAVHCDDCRRRHHPGAAWVR